MRMDTTVALVVGGTAGLGREVARQLAVRGQRVIITGRDGARAEAVAREIGGATSGIALDLGRPEGIAGSLVGIERVDHLVLAAVGPAANTVRDFDVERARQAATVKLVGYPEVVHVLSGRFGPGAAVVLFGGLAMERPSPGSTMITTANGGVSALVRSLASELAPVRVNAVHPGIVGDHPKYVEMDQRSVIARTPIGRLVTMAEVAGSVLFLLDHAAVNGINLRVDGGWMLR